MFRYCIILDDFSNKKNCITSFSVKKNPTHCRIKKGGDKSTTYHSIFGKNDPNSKFNAEVS